MYKAAIIIVIIIILIACQKKAIPVISERKSDPPKLIRTVYPPKETVPPDTLAGKRIFANRCGECHGLPFPQQYIATRWDKILEVMFVRAGLDNEEGLHVRTWIMANAKKS